MSAGHDAEMGCEAEGGNWGREGKEGKGWREGDRSLQVKHSSNCACVKGQPISSRFVIPNKAAHTHTHCGLQQTSCHTQVHEA